MTPTRRRWSLFAAVASAVVVASLLPVPAGGSERFLLGVGLDRWAHAVGYATVSLTFARAWGHADTTADGDTAADAGTTVRRVGMVAVVVGVVIGGCVELLQTAVATRSASVADAAANAVGAAVGASAWLGARR